MQGLELVVGVRVGEGVAHLPLLRGPHGLPLRLEAIPLLLTLPADTHTQWRLEKTG